ncbi:hypothetical protein ACH5RR_003052 [Cinchona calisaya]|uniref:BHLH domain-containing protein n=1 Tax=Cinchona calisaya TaxID=153742 RepID=A0ABD3AU31_9GENT
MLSISPPLFAYPLENLRSQQQNETETSESFLNSPTFQQQVGQNISEQFYLVNDQAKTAQKLDHNASERDRRKRINSLYYSLCCLLPPAHQEKKLSIPATVSRVLKYIPELQKEVESLILQKECLMTKISEQENSSPFKKQRNFGSSNVSAIRLGDREVMVQISSMKFNRCSYADVVSSLEQDGLLLLNSSCFESVGERVFYNLHLEMRGAQVMDLEGLKKKLLSLYEELKEPLCSNFLL